MLGLDDRIADLAGGSWPLALVVALVLGLRHATDPDHLTAVSMLGAGDEPDGVRRARRLGLAWGMGHATTLLVFGLPVVLFGAYLPAALQRGAELAVGIAIIAVAVRLLVRVHRRVHDHPLQRNGLGRTPRTAFGIGLVHGTGGSAGVSLLVLGSVAGDSTTAALCLAVLAVGAMVSMALVSSAFGYVLARGSIVRNVGGAMPALGVVGVLFGAWYALAALQAVRYPL
jgi:uncharacterized membrane protein YfcA